MGRYNPNYPTVLGNEFAPTAKDPEGIDPGSAFGYTFRSTDQEGIVTARVLMTQPPPGNPYRKNVCVEVYPDDQAPSTGPMRKLIVPVTSGANSTGASLQNAASYQAAVANPTDTSYVILTGPSAVVRFWFDTSTANVRLTNALKNARITNVSILYSITGDFSQYLLPVTLTSIPSPSPVELALERPSSASNFVMDNTINGELFHLRQVYPRVSRLGDYNPFWNTTIVPFSDGRRMPWKHRNGVSNFTGLEAMQATGGTNFNLRFQTSSAVPAGLDAFFVHYVAMEITYCAEGRVAAGSLDLALGAGLGDAMFYADVPLLSTTTAGAEWDSFAGSDHLVAVGQGYVGNHSLTHPVPVVVDRLVPARDTFNGHRGVLLRKTIREGEEWTREEVEAVPAVALYSSASVFDATTIYPPSQVYTSGLGNPVASLTFAGDAYAMVDDDVAGRTYTHVRFYARRQANTLDDLVIYRSNSSDVPTGPQATITVEAFEALPEVVNGWKEVTLELSAPWVTTGAGATRWQLESGADPAFPWLVLGADANPYKEAAGAYGAATYGGTAVYARTEDTSDLNADMSVMFIQALDVPADLAVVLGVQDLGVVDGGCGVPVEAMPTGIRYHQLSWTAVNDLAVAGFAHYEIQRRDTTMAADVWETIALITQVTTTDADDYEARVGVVSSYRIRQVHEDGYTSAWGTTATGTITTPGVTGTGVDSSVLILTSNHHPAGNLAYVMAWDGAALPKQDFTYPEGSATTLQEMYGRDYRVAFRPLERYGVEFTRTLLLNAAGVPAETLDRSALALRDLAWDTVPYVCTRDHAAHRWLAALSVPSSATREVASKGHLVVAPVTFVEVTATPAPIDYDSLVCEGIRLEGLDNFQYWTADAPAALYGTRTATDTFTRSVSSQWGTATTGQTWTAVGGVAANFSTTGSVGRIVSSTVTVDRRVTLSGSLGSHRTRIDFTVPAVATAGVYHAGLITRYQDASNYYYVKIEFATAGTFKMDVVKVVAGVATTISTGSSITTYTVGTVIHVEVMTRGTSLVARVWKDATSAPAWTAGTAATVSLPAEDDLAMTGLVGVQQTRAAANTNTNLQIDYDNLTVDALPTVLDWRVLVRPFADQFDVSYTDNEYTNNTDSEGGWALRVAYGGVTVSAYGNEFTQLTTTDLTGLGLVKNRQTWVRAVWTQDDGAGAARAQFYTLDDDGVTWNLVDTVTQPAPSQPIPPLVTVGGLLQVENYHPGGIWTKQYELRADAVLLTSPNFAAQAVGDEDFTDAQGVDWVGPEGRGICAALE